MLVDRSVAREHARHAQEVAAGLVDANGKPLKGKKGGANKARVVEVAGWWPGAAKPVLNFQAG